MKIDPLRCLFRLLRLASRQLTVATTGGLLGRINNAWARGAKHTHPLGGEQAGPGSAVASETWPSGLDLARYARNEEPYYGKSQQRSPPPARLRVPSDIPQACDRRSSLDNARRLDSIMMAQQGATKRPPRAKTDAHQMTSTIIRRRTVCLLPEHI